MIACLLAFVGCQNEELVNENTNNGGEKVILTANIQGATDSRVALTPATDNEGNPIVKVAWNESGETFEVYGSSGASSTFTQIAGTNQFEGELPETANGKYEAYYGDPNSLDDQDGKLGQSTATDSPVLMSAIFNSSSPSITFEHVTAILKPTFKVNGEAINNTITKIVMGGVPVSYSDNELYIDEITIPPTSSTTAMDDDIYIHLLVFPQVYIAGHEFTFTVTAGGKEYTGSLTIPNGMSIVEGKLFTATIALTEVCNLPNGQTFKMAILNVLPDDKSVQVIKFVAGSSADDTSAFDPNYNWKMPTNAKYKIIDATATTPKTLEIHTTAEVFMFNTSCYRMFDANISTSNELSEITTIDFNNCINTSNVTSMTDMFQACGKLTSLDLSSFKFKNNVSVKDMFFYTGYTSRATKIIVDEDGYNYLKDKSTSINSDFAKYVKPDGVTPWETSTP